MSQSSRFENLPLIIHDCILRSLPAPKDVANTIRASPRCLHAFVTGRRNILLSALHKFLPPRTQNLMNLVMATPHFYYHEQSQCNSNLCAVVDGYKFIDEFNHFIDNHDLTVLSTNTLVWSLKLYSDIDKAIADYNSFTFARSQHRVPRLSTPDASRSRYISSDLPPPDDEETQRLWRGFLLYELLCRIEGVLEITAADSRSNGCLVDEYDYMLYSVNAKYVLMRMPMYMREEVMCIREYVRAQYDLAFNELVESFELAVTELGRRALDKPTSLIGFTEPIHQLLKSQNYASNVNYLVEPPHTLVNAWSTNMAMLGLRFLRKFLCWDLSIRLSVIRKTYQLLGDETRDQIDCASTLKINNREMAKVHFGWDGHTADNLPLMYTKFSFPSKSRMRSVGWIFWKNPRRLHLMKLDDDLLKDNYGGNGKVRPSLRLQCRLHLLEASVQRQDWERIVQQFGAPSPDHQVNKFMRLFRVICDPNSYDRAYMDSILRR